MSKLNLGLLIGALAFFSLLLANALVYRRRFGSFLRPEAKARVSVARVNLSQLASAAAVVLAGLAALAAPILAPESGFALWLQEPFSLVLYAAWSLILIVAVGVLSAIVRFLATRA